MGGVLGFSADDYAGIRVSAVIVTTTEAFGNRRCRSRWYRYKANKPISRSSRKTAFSNNRSSEKTFAPVGYFHAN